MQKVLPWYFQIKKEGGFTLIEVLIVATISSVVVISLLTNFLRSEANVNETAQALISDIRTVQANTLNSKQFRDPVSGSMSYRCGYGLDHQHNNTTSYFLYAGLVNSSSICSGDKEYKNNSSTPVIITKSIDSRLELVENSLYKDMYFEVPDGKIYIKNKHSPSNIGQNKSQILIRKKGASCPSKDCLYVCVYAFGRIESRSTACPDLLP